MEAVIFWLRQTNHGKIMGKIWGNGDLTNNTLGFNGIYSWEKSMKIINASYVRDYWIDK